MKHDREEKGNVPNKGNFPKLRFSNFIDEWKKYKVSNILEFFPTNSLSWDQLEYGIDNIYNLHYGLIHKGLSTQIELDKCSLPNIKEDFISKNYVLCKDGDVAFADASEDTNDVGKVVEFLNCDGKNIVCGLHTIHGRDKKGLTIKGFKGYVFSSEIFRNQIRILAQGTKIYSISPKNFKDVSIGIPSKEEQSKIASLLRLLDERIATQSKTIEKLESLIKRLNNKLLKCGTNKEPNLRFPEFLVKWKVICLKNIAVKINAKNKENNVNVVFSNSATQGLILQNEYFDRDIANKENLCEYYIVAPGDFVYNPRLSSNAEVGAMNVNHTKYTGLVSPLYTVFRINNSDFNVTFLESIFKSKVWHNYMRSIANYGARNDRMNIRNDDFFDLPLFIPQKPEQQKIADFFMKIGNIIETEKNMLRKYSEQKQFLLQNMFI